MTTEGAWQHVSQQLANNVAYAFAVKSILTPETLIASTMVEQKLLVQRNRGGYIYL